MQKHLNLSILFIKNYRSSDLGHQNVVIADLNQMTCHNNKCQPYRIWSFVLRCIFYTSTPFFDNQNDIFSFDNYFVEFQNLFTPSFELLTLITTGHNVNAQDEKQVLSIFTSLETFSTLTSQTCLCIYLYEMSCQSIREKSHEENPLIRMDTT